MFARCALVCSLLEVALFNFSLIALKVFNAPALEGSSYVLPLNKIFDNIPTYSVWRFCLYKFTSPFISASKTIAVTSFKILAEEYVLPYKVVLFALAKEDSFNKHCNTYDCREYTFSSGLGSSELPKKLNPLLCLCK